MPAPASPVDRIRTIAWYRAIQSELGTHTYRATADALYELTLDDRITDDQCVKWAKGRRNSKKWIAEINQHLPAVAQLTYECGPAGEPLWGAFNLPSRFPDPLFMLSGGELKTGDAVLDLVVGASHPTIRELAISVAGFMHACELAIFDASTAELQSSATVFLQADDWIAPSVEQNRTRLAAVRKAYSRLAVSARRAEPDVQLPAKDMISTAVNQLLHLSKRYHPRNVDVAGMFGFLRVH